jgi:ubiquinone/menaquinone biosynthesis C-methylase UbiE
VKTVLHVGCGSKVNKPPAEFGAYKEVRLDCNRMVQPDILASVVAMPMIEDGTHDGVFASHVLEHLFAHEAAMALSEFFRILRPGGKVLIQVPDLQTIGGRLACDKADEAVYTSAIGYITPLDMLYGHRGSIGAGNLFMGHRMGYTQSILSKALRHAGFDSIEVDRGVEYELKCRALKPLSVEAASVDHERTA